MRDVARLAGVSIGTVSNTINRPDMVRPDTREAVLKAIEELGFVPNQQARVLSGASSRVIGLVVLDVGSPFFMSMALAVEKAANEAGYAMMLCNSGGSAAKEKDLLAMLAAQRVLGVLLTASGRPDRAKHHDSPVPLVHLGYPGGANDCSVYVDERAGARAAAEHLLALGHERIAYVGGTRSLRHFEERRAGIHSAVIAAGLDPEVTLVDASVDGGFGTEQGITAAQQLLEGDLPTAIMCGNDMLAFGVYKGLHRAGVRVPDDVALVGYDDIDFAADWVVPLTSVRQPTHHIGDGGARLLIEHATGGPGHVHRHVVLQPELMVRQSSDPRATS